MPHAAAAAQAAQPLLPPIAPAAGTLLLSRTGTGPASIDLPAVPAGHQLTINVICGGGAGFTMDTGGAPLRMDFGGRCDRHTTYGVRVTPGKAHRVLVLSMGKAAIWRVGIWQSRKA